MVHGEPILNSLGTFSPFAIEAKEFNEIQKVIIV